MSNTYTLNITKGSSFNIYLNAQNSNGTYINLNGYWASGYIRANYSNTGILYNLNPVIDPSYVSGLILISGYGAATASLPIGEYPYDVTIYNSGGYVTRVLQGYCQIYPETTW